MTDFFNHANTVANIMSLVLDMKNSSAISKLSQFFRKPKTTDVDPSVSGVTNPSSSAAPATPTESVDSWGLANNKALAALETMLAIEPGSGPFGGRPLTVSREQREAFGIFTGLLTPGEGKALENVFALAPGEKVWVRIAWLAPAAAGGAPTLGRKRYETWARPRGVRIYRAIADDILFAANPAGKRARANRLVKQMRKLHILDNFPDDVIAAARQAKLLVSQADTSGHEFRAQQKLGFDGRLWAKISGHPKLKAKRSDIEAAEPIDAIRFHEEYQELLIARTTALVNAELRKRRWQFGLRRTTIRGRSVSIPVVQPGKLTGSTIIRLGAVTVIALLIIILAINA